MSRLSGKKREIVMCVTLGILNVVFHTYRVLVLCGKQANTHDLAQNNIHKMQHSKPVVISTR